MKQKIVNYLKIGILVFGISIFLSNCQTDEADELISPKESSGIKKGKIKNYGQLFNYVEKLENRRSSEVNAKASSLETNNGFDILYDQDMFIQEVGSNTTYSIPIIKSNQPTGTFSNLIVSFSETEETEAFILNYEPTDEYIDEVYLDEQTPFKGNFSSESINYDGSLDSLEKNGGCITVTTKYCDFDDGQHGDTHLGGANCTVGFYWYVTTTYCFGDEPSLVDVPTPGSGDPSATDYITDPSNVSSGGSQGNPINSPVVVPNVPNANNLLGLGVLTQEMNEWFIDNIEFRRDMIDFLSEEDPLNMNELEAYLMIKSESSTEPWLDYSGNFNNIPSLGYTQLRHMADPRGYIYTEFKLLNGDIILHGDYSVTGDFLQLTHYYSKGARRLFRIPEPYLENENVDLEILWENFWSVVQTGARYCTPIEDAIILIDGKDFDGVESSRAVAGVMILIEIIPIGKVTKIVKRGGQALSNTVPVITRIVGDIYTVQKAAFKRYRGIIASSSNAKKGRWAEMGTDVDMIGKGYRELHTTRITSIDNGGHHGIDHVFRNPENGEYLIVETKYKGSGNTVYMNSPNNTTGLPRQMSDAWITHNNNLVNAVGEDLAIEITSAGYRKIASIVNPDGTITYRLINEFGDVINTADGIFTP